MYASSETCAFSDDWNASDLSIAALRAGYKSLDFLKQDKPGISERLDRLGLPHAKNYFFRAEDLASDSFRGLFKDGVNSYFCRLIPNDGGKRPYRAGISTYLEMLEFCSNYNLNHFLGNLVQMGDVTHTGGIIAQDSAAGLPGRCIVEVLAGSGKDLFHGRRTPQQILVDEFLRVARVSAGMDESCRAFALRALRMVGGPKHPYPGYYEFEVWAHKEIVFRNFQTSNSAYASL